MKPISSIVIVAFLMVFTNLSFAEEYKITGIFSNLHYNEEGGDLLGEEIFISYGGDGSYYASVQCAQGGVRPPFLIKLEINTNKIAFNIPDSWQ